MADFKPEPGEIAPGIHLDSFLPYLLNRIVSRLNLNLTDDLKAIGVTLQHYRVLAVLVAREGRTVNELAVYTVTDQSTLSKLLDRMEAKGLVERRPDPSDGRVVNVHLTPAGRKAYARIIPIALEHYGRAIDGLTKVERETLVRTLGKVLENVRRSPFP